MITDAILDEAIARAGLAVERHLQDVTSTAMTRRRVLLEQDEHYRGLICKANEIARAAESELSSTAKTTTDAERAWAAEKSMESIHAAARAGERRGLESKLSELRQTAQSLSTAERNRAAERKHLMRRYDEWLSYRASARDLRNQRLQQLAEQRSTVHGEDPLWHSSEDDRPTTTSHENAGSSHVHRPPPLTAVALIDEQTLADLAARVARLRALWTEVELTAPSAAAAATSSCGRANELDEDIEQRISAAAAAVAASTAGDDSPRYEPTVEWTTASLGAPDQPSAPREALSGSVGSRAEGRSRSRGDRDGRETRRLLETLAVERKRVASLQRRIGGVTARMRAARAAKEKALPHDLTDAAVAVATAENVAAAGIVAAQQKVAFFDTTITSGFLEREDRRASIRAPAEAAETVLSAYLDALRVRYAVGDGYQGGSGKRRRASAPHTDEDLDLWEVEDGDCDWLSVPEGSPQGRGWGTVWARLRFDAEASILIRACEAHERRAMEDAEALSL